MNYKQQLAVVEGLFIPPDSQIRMDCPFCNGKNTLSIDTTENKIGWYCFHASCKAKGKVARTGGEYKGKKVKSKKYGGPA